MTEAIPFFELMQGLFALHFNVNQFAVNHHGVTLVLVRRLLSASALLKVTSFTVSVGSHFLTVFVTGAAAFLAAGSENHNASENEGANSKYFLHNDLIFNRLINKDIVTNDLAKLDKK